MPYYTLNDDGGLTRHNSFKSGQPMRTVWYKILGWCGLMNIPAVARPEVQQRDIDLAASIIKHSEEAYLSQYPRSKFYVVCYPSRDIPHEYELLVQSLKEKGLNVLDYRRLFSMDSAHTIIGDGHPNELANKLVVERLKIDLGK
jgi:hypothetical protein